jgi:cytochrome c553
VYNPGAFSRKSTTVSSTKKVNSVQRLAMSIPLALVAVLSMSLVATELRAQDGEVDAGQSKSTACAACHGPDGNAAPTPQGTPTWPSLAGQHAKYIVRQLNAYKNRERPDASMQGFAATLSEQDMADIAAYYSAQTLAPKGADPSLVDRGERIYRGGVPERGIAACIACHGPTGHGNPLAGYPRVSHQHANYLAATLEAYRSGERRSDANLNQMMRNVAELLLDDEIDALASYMQGLN